MPRWIDIFQASAVEYMETNYPNEYTICDVYRFTEDNSRDLAIISIKPHGQTPLQKVLEGDVTEEGYVTGQGQLTVNQTIYQFPSEERQSVEVRPGDVMQWEAYDSELVFYELCTPPYVDGRFMNL